MDVGDKHWPPIVCWSKKRALGLVSFRIYNERICMLFGLIPTATRSSAWKRKRLGSSAAPFTSLLMHLGWTSLRRRFCHFPGFATTIKSTPFRKACNALSSRDPWVQSKVGGHAILLGDDVNYLGNFLLIFPDFKFHRQSRRLRLVGPTHQMLEGRANRKPARERNDVGIRPGSRGI